MGTCGHCKPRAHDEGRHGQLGGESEKPLDPRRADIGSPTGSPGGGRRPRPMWTGGKPWGRLGQGKPLGRAAGPGLFRCSISNRDEVRWQVRRSVYIALVSGVARLATARRADWPPCPSADRCTRGGHEGMCWYHDVTTRVRVGTRGGHITIPTLGQWPRCIP